MYPGPEERISEIYFYSKTWTIIADADPSARPMIRYFEDTNSVRDMVFPELTNPEVDSINFHRCMDFKLFSQFILVFRKLSYSFIHFSCIRDSNDLGSIIGCEFQRRTLELFGDQVIHYSWLHPVIHFHTTAQCILNTKSASRGQTHIRDWK